MTSGEKESKVSPFNIPIAMHPAHFIIFVFILPSVSLQGDETSLPGNLPEESQSCTDSAPVTDECVEAGLRQKRETLRHLPEFQPDRPEIHVKLAETLMQQGDPNGAIEEYQAAIGLNPGFAEAFHGLGAVYLDKHEWKRAEEALQKSTQLGYQDSRTYFWLGRSLLAQGKFEDAETALTAATRSNSLEAEVYSDLGLTYMAQGNPRDASKALRQAIRLRPDFSEAHHRLEMTETFRKDQKLLIQETSKLLHILFRGE